MLKLLEDWRRQEACEEVVKELLFVRRVSAKPFESLSELHKLANILLGGRYPFTMVRRIAKEDGNMAYKQLVRRP